MQHYRQLQCERRQRAPGSPTLAHSALRQHPLFTKPLSIIVFVGNVYFFHSNLSFPQSQSSRQPARWSPSRGRERENEIQHMPSVVKTHQNPNRLSPSPPSRGCKAIRSYFFIFFSALSSPLIHNCLSSLTADAGWLYGCTMTRDCFNLLGGYHSTYISLFFPRW